MFVGTRGIGMQITHLAAEWSLLQNQSDSYEKHSLLIKLLGITLLAIAMFIDTVSALMLIVLAVVWLQDAIWKTFQARIEERLVTLETALASCENTGQAHDKAYQFNTRFLQTRPGGTALVGEYLKQAVRPTVAFPHVLLIATLLVRLIT